MSNEQYDGNTQQSPYEPPAGAPQGQQQQQPQHQQQYHQQQPSNPSAGYRPTDEALLPTGQERSEQMETMQSYEMNRPQTEDDRAQDALQLEFPNIDSSLIAAIWSDNKDMSAAKEMLQHLSS